MSDANKAVFISYAREDVDAARRIAEALRSFGLAVWFDQNELRGGEEWDAKLRTQIRTCTMFMPVISAATQARSEGYFRREWSYAIDRSRNIAEGAIFILPITIDDTNGGDAQVPEKFKAVHFTHLPDGEITPEFAQRLKDFLSARHS